MRSILDCPQPNSTPPDPPDWECPVCPSGRACYLVREYNIPEESVDALTRSVSQGDLHAVQQWIKNVDFCNIPPGHWGSYGGRRAAAQLDNTVALLRLIADHIDGTINAGR